MQALVQNKTFNTTLQIKVTGHAAFIPCDLGIMFFFTVVARSQNPSLSSQDAPPKVRTTLITSADHQTWTLSGTVQSRNEAELGFRLAGQINERLVMAASMLRLAMY